MKNMFKVACFLLILSLSNCNSAKVADTKNTSNVKNDVQQITSTEMTEKGYSKGTITVNKSSDCPYILTIEEFKDNLDPINLKEFFKDDMPEQVWVKFASLRMANRCSNARPVSILEINKRTE